MIVTPDIWQQWSGFTVSGDQLTSLASVCPQVDQAIKNRLKRTVERADYANLIFDAPATATILLSRWAPIIASSLVIYQNDLANGDPTNGFTTVPPTTPPTYLLTAYQDYLLDTGPDDPTLSLSGVVTRLAGNGCPRWWGIASYCPPYSMAYQRVPIKGAVKLSFTGGYTTVPNDLIEAACITVSKVLGVRKYGMQVGSENWNGYSYNLPGVGMMMNGLLGNPDIRGLLEPYVNYADVIG